MMATITPYLIALLATIAIEAAVIWWLLGDRRKKVVLSSVVVNIITNVPLNIVLQHTDQTFTAIAIGEAVVFLVETLWYCLFLRDIKRAAVYSFLCNGISFAVGVLGVWVLGVG